MGGSTRIDIIKENHDEQSDDGIYGDNKSKLPRKKLKRVEP